LFAPIVVKPVPPFDISRAVPVYDKLMLGVVVGLLTETAIIVVENAPTVVTVPTSFQK
jgi:hypothetical protein